MNIDANDPDLVQVMKRYFAVKAEVAALKMHLEQARKSAGQDIHSFYNPRTNLQRADEILRSHELRSEMIRLIELAEHAVSQSEPIDTTPTTDQADSFEASLAALEEDAADMAAPGHPLQ
ncbi:hypothetical protein MRS76_09340 [Rhizobiaceae bacterium n13]|uniref:Uncharacterized protein n=1 Tax=Ferirhizobium litorale TaxID=2927786 RepID=A0AAE3QFT4_9HYPH|nr:hypothetical protein [Fererhizobium litorale]MDI7862161.1 hypothetical protein [Fererhizobium litorale]MDI7922566.1 hypothetical protein [Fererhizobium litorale]